MGPILLLWAPHVKQPPLQEGQHHPGGGSLP